MSEQSGHNLDGQNSKLPHQETLEDDFALMSAIAARSVRALDLIYDRYSAYLFAICRRMLKDRAAAEEVLQDIFFEIWRLPARFNPTRGSPAIYFAHLARSRAIDRWRKERKRRVECSSNSETELPLISTPFMNNAPPHVAELREQISRMKSALGRLSKIHRIPVELAFLDGLSHTEISMMLSIPLGTIKARIRTGLIRLRDEFQSTSAKITPDAIIGAPATAIIADALV